MNRILQIILLSVLIGFNISSFSQQGTTTFGLQFKPIIPIKFLNVEDLNLKEDHFSSTVSQKLGYNFGAVIRWGISKNISIESGLSYIKRNYSMSNSLDSVNIFNEKGDFSSVLYEFPIQALMYVRLSKKIYMNVATGISLNWRASSIGSYSENNNFYQVTYIRKLNFAYIANVGFEYRSKKYGYYYIGASITSPFNTLGLIEVKYINENGFNRKISGDLSGSYISIDLRYFFNENNKKKKK